MKTVLITGGCGAVGTAFIKTFYHQYQFVSYSRNKEKQVALKQQFNKIELCDGSIEDCENLLHIFLKVKPDIVIHAAALKHINIAEKEPTQAVKVNLLGSLNVIEASQAANVPITIGISSDKACLSNSVYGHTKNLMERVFLEANNEKNRFLCCRLCNVAGSHGSVIPFWLNLAKKNKSLKITDPKMNRFMILPEEVAFLIRKAIDSASPEKGAFVLTKKIKTVNMYDMAAVLSPCIDIVGKRPGERLNETLVSIHETPFTDCDGEYIYIKTQKNTQKKTRLQSVLNTLKSEQMSKTEITSLINSVESMYENIN